MKKKLVACQECNHKTNPDAIACSGCGLSVTPETIEMGKRYEKKISMLTLGYFMILIIPFCLFLIFDGMRSGDIPGEPNHCEIALGAVLVLIALVVIGYVFYQLFVKKK